MNINRIAGVYKMFIVFANHDDNQQENKKTLH